jgi:hypothetical protein
LEVFSGGKAQVILRMEAICIFVEKENLPEQLETNKEK